MRSKITTTSRVVPLLALLIFLFTDHPLAQISKGHLLLEGSIGDLNISKTNTKYLLESTANTSKGNEFGFSLYPTVGVCLTNNIVVGSSIECSFFNNKYAGYDDNNKKVSSSKYINTSVGLFPFLRYYIPVNKKGSSYFFVQISGGANIDLSSKNEYIYYDGPSGNITSTAKYNYIKQYPQIKAGISGGFTRFMAKEVALHAMVGYQYFRNKEKTTYESTPAGGTTTSSPESTYTYENKGFTWNIGISAFIPSCNKKK